MRLIPSKSVLVIGLVWGSVSSLVMFGLFRSCLTFFGFAPSWCDSPLTSIVGWTVGLPAISALVIDYVSGISSFLNDFSGFFELIILTIVSIILAIVASFVLDLLIRIILKIFK